MGALGLIRAPSRGPSWTEPPVVRSRRLARSPPTSVRSPANVQDEIATPRGLTPERAATTLGPATAARVAWEVPRDA